MKGWKAWGGEWDWCEHEHETWDDARVCAEATGRREIVQTDNIVVREDGSWELGPIPRDVYVTGKR